MIQLKYCCNHVLEAWTGTFALVKSLCKSFYWIFPRCSQTLLYERDEIQNKYTEHMRAAPLLSLNMYTTMSSLSPHMKYSCKCNKPKVIRERREGLINNKTISSERSKRKTIMNSSCYNNRQWMNERRIHLREVVMKEPCWAHCPRPRTTGNDRLFAQKLRKNKQPFVDSEESESGRFCAWFLLLCTGFCLKNNSFPIHNHPHESSSVGN